jgi:prepilin-type N-terminal cleavage/methylation domain-containing protein
MHTPITRARAFTLIEILIVVVILGILAAISVPQFARAAEDSKLTATLVDLGKIRRAVQVYQTRHDAFLPPIIDGALDWGPLTGNGSEYMSSPPTNQVIGGENSRRVLVRNTPDSAFHRDYGWVFDPVSGEVWAAGFDAEDRLLPPP